jgi:CHASE3 domain sensor protein
MAVRFREKPHSIGAETISSGGTVNKISLKMKLGLGFGALLLIMAIMSAMSYTSIHKLSDLSDEVAKQMYKLQLSTEVDAALELQTSGTRGYVLSGGELPLQRRDEGITQNDKAVGELRKLLQTERGKELSAHLETSAKELREIQGHAIELRREGKIKEATDLLFSGHATQVRVEAEKTIDDLIGQEDQLRATAETNHEQVEASTVRLMVILAAAGIFIGVGIAVLIVRSIHRSISRMLSVIQEIAKKNLTISDIEITSGDELGKAGIALNEMKKSLHDVIHQIAATAEHVASASEELSATSQQISANSEQTSAQAGTVTQATQQVSQNLHSVSTGAEEMTATIQSIATNAHEAATVASNAVSSAQAANSTVAKLGASSV